MQELDNPLQGAIHGNNLDWKALVQWEHCSTVHKCQFCNTCSYPTSTSVVLQHLQFELSGTIVNQKIVNKKKISHICKTLIGIQRLTLYIEQATNLPSDIPILGTK